jgi:hypothetical protein
MDTLLLAERRVRHEGAAIHALSVGAAPRRAATQQRHD